MPSMMKSDTITTVEITPERAIPSYAHCWRIDNRG